MRVCSDSSSQRVRRFAGPDVRLSRLPGWEKNSWGYYGDDGLSFAAERTGLPYGPMFGSAHCYLSSTRNPNDIS
jgi:hypothetical protein